MSLFPRQDAWSQLCYLVQKWRHQNDVYLSSKSAVDSNERVTFSTPSADTELLLVTSFGLESKCVFIFPGLALIDAGEAMRELGEVKDALDMEVKQNFIDPLQNLHEKDLKEIQVGEHTHFSHTDTQKKEIIIYQSINHFWSSSAASPEENGGSSSGLWL